VSWRDAATAAASEIGAATAVWANPSNLATVNEILGDGAGDRLIDRLLAALEGLGWRARGEDGVVVALIPGEIAGVIDALRPISWLSCLRVGVTEGWRAGGGPIQPSRYLELASAPRFGLAFAADGAGLGAAWEAAAADCERQRSDPRGASRHGFAPVGLRALRTLADLGEARCRRCGHAACEHPRERVLIA
jgi:hypothetical protein